jgi:predicted DNA-binding protein with PD1-like motif
MKFSQGKIKRIFVIKLQDNEKLPEVIENFASEQKINCAICLLIGGIGSGKLVSGPEKPDKFPINPILESITGTSEILGVGTIFPDEKNFPRLHMHAATGRRKKTLTGCIRPGICVWKIAEFIIIELEGLKGKRKKDKKAGFSVLEI